MRRKQGIWTNPEIPPRAKHRQREAIETVFHTVAKGPLEQFLPLHVSSELEGGNRGQADRRPRYRIDQAQICQSLPRRKPARSDRGSHCLAGSREELQRFGAFLPLRPSMVGVIRTGPVVLSASDCSNRCS